MEYSAKVMDHFMNPRNVGEIEDASGVGTVGNAKCGDIMKVYLQIEDGIIQDAKFKTFGCGAPCKGTLFLSGRRSSACGTLGLCRKKSHCYRRSEKACQ